MGGRVVGRLRPQKYEHFSCNVNCGRIAVRTFSQNCRSTAIDIFGCAIRHSHNDTHVHFIWRKDDDKASNAVQGFVDLILQNLWFVRAPGEFCQELPDGSLELRFQQVGDVDRVVALLGRFVIYRTRPRIRLSASKMSPSVNLSDDNDTDMETVSQPSSNEE